MVLAPQSKDDAEEEKEEEDDDDVMTTTNAEGEGNAGRNSG